MYIKRFVKHYYIMLIFQCFISLGNVEIVIIILSICIFSLILEIALKVI